LEGYNDVLIVNNVFLAEGSSLAIFAPLLTHLIATHIKIPNFFRDSSKAIVFFVDDDLAIQILMLSHSSK